MKKQIVKIGDKFAARQRKNRWCKWKYLGINCIWKEDYLTEIQKYCLVDSEEEAEKKFKWFNKEFEVVKIIK